MESRPMTHILVVEDTAVLRQEIRFILEMEGFQVSEAEDGESAYKLLQTESFDVIVCDIMMPIMDGLDLLKKLEHELAGGRPPFIFLTARTAHRDIRAAMASGADDYLVKPFDADELLDAVKTRIRKKEELRAVVEAATTEVEIRYQDVISQQEGELERQRIDVVTGIGNLMSFDESLAEICSGDPKTSRGYALTLIHLNNYGDALVAHGVEFARSVRKNAAALLKDLEEKDCECFALGDNRFALLTRFDSPADVERFAEKIEMAVKNPVSTNKEKFRLRISLGIYHTDKPTFSSREEAVAKAEDALFISRNQKYGKYHILDDSKGEDSSGRRMIEADLFKAVEENKLTVHYQPKLDAVTKRVIGVEALVRWFHPEIGAISPGVFIPVAEENGSIVDLGRQVMEMALEDMKKVHELGYKIPCSINISPVQWQNDDVASMVEAAIERAGIPAQSVYVELTESGLVQNFDQVIERLNRLRARGIQVSLDDFGTGYSSFSMLSRVPLDELKIDRAFVQNIPGSKDDEHIAKAIINVGIGLGLQLVAEGIETLEQSNWLAEQGCTIFQGFYYSRPLSYHDLTLFLEKSNPTRDAIEG
jgi:diguanylate cyclase